MKNRGFTLIELVVAAAITALLTGILAPSFVAYIRRTQTAVCEENRRALLNELDLSIIEDDGGTMDDFILAFTEFSAEYIGNHSMCPAKGNIRFRFRWTESGITGSVSCSEHKTPVSGKINIY